MKQYGNEVWDVRWSVRGKIKGDFTPKCIKPNVEPSLVGVQKLKLLRMVWNTFCFRNFWNLKKFWKLHFFATVHRWTTHRPDGHYSDQLSRSALDTARLKTLVSLVGLSPIREPQSVYVIAHGSGDSRGYLHTQCFPFLHYPLSFGTKCNPSASIHIQCIGSCCIMSTGRNKPDSHSAEILTFAKLFHCTSLKIIMTTFPILGVSGIMVDQNTKNTFMKELHPAGSTNLWQIILSS